MKKIVCICLFFTALILPVTAQAFDDLEQSFNDFSDTIASSLPFNALVGQQWSDAFIGKFPHLGAGGTLGITLVPYETVQPVMELLEIDLPEELAFLQDYGMPLPAYSIDARLGLPVLPMDVGIKFGMLPQGVQGLLPDSISMDYLMMGADLRFALVEETAVLPDVSIGAGYSFLRGSLIMTGLTGSEITITDLAGYNIALSDPDLTFQWETSVIDLKAQVSKKLLFITPFAGLGASYGISSAGGGLESVVLLDGEEIQTEDIESINSILGEDAPDLSGQGILIDSAVSGWAVRIFGGVGLNMAVVHLDLGLMYNLTSQAYGGALNLRLQL